MKQVPIEIVYAFCRDHAIDREMAERERHAFRAKTGLQRATIVLRLLLGEREWSDGYERRLDDCFEMGDGDEVVRHLLAFAEADSRIERLLNSHRNTRGALDAWRRRSDGTQLTLPLE